MRADEFYAFMQKREKVRLQKEAGLPFPWTDDPILREFKFTNVRRHHDRTTRGLRKIYGRRQDQPLEACLLNCAMYRYFGTLEFARAVGWWRDFRPDVIKAVAADRLEKGLRVFTGAYVVTNQGIKDKKYNVVTDIFLAGIWEKRCEILHAAAGGSWRAMIEEMAKVPGFGGTGFMAKEVALDTMYTPIWPQLPEDFNRWCPLGPGAQRGLNRVMGHDKSHRMNRDDALGLMKVLRLRQDGLWPVSAWGRLSLHDVQFQLCEFDKYERVRLGEGRPRSRYKVRTN